MKTKSTNTTIVPPAPAGCAPYRLTPSDAVNVNPATQPDCWSYLQARRERQREHLAPMWAMTVPQRIAAMRRGELTMAQLTHWAARHPEQVPTINGEFEFIAAFMPEIAEEED